MQTRPTFAAAIGAIIGLYAHDDYPIADAMRQHAVTLNPIAFNGFAAPRSVPMHGPIGSNFGRSNQRKNRKRWRNQRSNGQRVR